MTTTITRFAPSPTGFQHVGGFRTAIYAWLLARKNQGEFILRIENTDQQRSVEGAVAYIVDSLHWLGIDYDRGPTKSDLEAMNEASPYAPEASFETSYIQSERLSIYQDHAEQLVSSGAAYRCDCTSERLDAERAEQKARRERPGYSGYCRTRQVPADTKHVVRLKLPDQIKLSINDAVRGKIFWDNPPLADPVLFKSDGFPTYHLASVVDDHLMNVTHVLRGEEWLPTTPIHILLYEALGWEIPEFVHLSHILGPDGKKLSKRHGAEAINQYAELGILPEALVNYICLIGWSPTAKELADGETEQEIFSLEELIQEFSLAGLSKSGGVFDPEKLLWMNGVYLRNLPAEKFSTLMAKEILPAKLSDAQTDLLAFTVQERIKSTLEIIPLLDFIWEQNSEPEIAAALKGEVTPEVYIEICEAAASALGDILEFNPQSIETALKAEFENFDLKLGKFLIAVRIAVTGKKSTPPLFESIAALGQAESIRRLQDQEKFL